jgi:hypothetical protein
MEHQVQFLVVEGVDQEIIQEAQGVMVRQL